MPDPVANAPIPFSRARAPAGGAERLVPAPPPSPPGGEASPAFYRLDRPGVRVDISLEAWIRELESLGMSPEAIARRLGLEPDLVNSYLASA